MIHLTCNLHTHTSRCGHAYGTDEEYVISAIQNGFKQLGFSDHVMIPNCDSYIRGDYSCLEGYLKSIDFLKEKYKDKIQILKGFECEYVEALEPYLRSLKERKEVDYLILGQHFLRYKNRDFQYYAGDRTTPFSPDLLEEYKNLAIKALKSGLFCYYAHPDLFLSSVTHFTKEIDQMIEELCQTAKDCNIPMEINLGPIRFPDRRIRDGQMEYRYPSRHFFEIAKNVGVTIVIGVDAHHPNDFDMAQYNDFFEELNEWSLEIQEPKINPKAI